MGRVEEGKGGLQVGEMCEWCGVCGWEEEKGEVGDVGW